MRLAQKLHSKEEMEANRIKFYERFAKIKTNKKITVKNMNKLFMWLIIILMVSVFVFGFCRIIDRGWEIAVIHLNLILPESIL